MSTFQKLLEDYIDVTEKDALKRKEIEEKIWESYGNKGAIIVWDMSNFSSTAKNMGIVYFLSLMEIAKNEYIPIIEKHNGISIKILADDIFAKFDTVNDAINCAFEIKDIFCNTPIPYWWKDKRNATIQLSCGISYGDFLEIKENDKLVNVFGDCVNKAFRMGEDIAKNGQILIDEKSLSLYESKLNKRTIKTSQKYKVLSITES